MKKTMVSIWVLALLNLWVPGVRAEISQDLDPMIPVDSQATVAEGTPVSGVTTTPTSPKADATAPISEETKKEKSKKEKEKEKAKKKSSKKSSTKKNNKSGSKHSKAGKTGKTGKTSKNGAY